MIVVVAAGNDGLLGMGTINTPGDSPGAITVSASTNVHSLSSTVSTLTGDRFDARFGDGPAPVAPLRASLLTVSHHGFPPNTAVWDFLGIL